MTSRKRRGLSFTTAPQFKKYGYLTPCAKVARTMEAYIRVPHGDSFHIMGTGGKRYELSLYYSTRSGKGLRKSRRKPDIYPRISHCDSAQLGHGRGEAQALKQIPLGSDPKGSANVAAITASFLHNEAQHLPKSRRPCNILCNPEPLPPCLARRRCP